jgi:hypothetical protein
VRPSSTAMSTKLLRVKRHHASSSGPMAGSPLITATRSPLRLRRSAAIKSGKRPEANVLVPASSSTFAFVLTRCTIDFASRNPRRSGAILRTFHVYRTSFAPETILQKAMKTINLQRKYSKISDHALLSCAHNDLVRGSSPGRPPHFALRAAHGAAVCETVAQSASGVARARNTWRPSSPDMSCRNRPTCETGASTKGSP